MSNGYSSADASSQSHELVDVISISTELKDSFLSQSIDDNHDSNVKEAYQLLYEKIDGFFAGKNSISEIIDSDDSELSTESVADVFTVLNDEIDTDIESHTDENESEDNISMSSSEESESEDDRSTGSLSNSKKTKFSSKFNTASMRGNHMMFPAAGLHVSDVLLMVETFSVHKNFSQRDDQDLINFVKVLAGPEFKYWNASHYLRSKCYDPPSMTINLNFYCVKCNCILGVKEVKDCGKREYKVCDNCQNQYEVSSIQPNHFVTVDLQYQLSLLLNDRDI